MGCDIHMFIEYKGKSEPEKTQWKSFGGEIRGWRNYTLFTNLAGVRGVSDKEPKGIPEYVGHNAFDKISYYITDKTDYREGYISKEQAEKSVSDYGQQYIKPHDSAKPTGWVTNSDLHSHSWATIEEFKQALNETGNYHDEYKVVLHTMAAFDTLGYDVRLFYCFDN